MYYLQIKKETVQGGDIRMGVVRNRTNDFLITAVPDADRRY